MRARGGVSKVMAHGGKGSRHRDAAPARYSGGQPIFNGRPEPRREGRADGCLSGRMFHGRLTVSDWSDTDRIGPAAPEPDVLDPDGGKRAGRQGGGQEDSQSRLGDIFFAALLEDFRAHGAEAIRAVRTDNPTNYVRVVAGLLPRDRKIEQPLEEMSDAELAILIAAVRASIAASSGSGSGGRAPGRRKSAGGVPALSKAAGVS